VKHGVAPNVLWSQVQSTAPWLTGLPGAETACAWLADHEAAAASQATAEPDAYTRMLLAAHWATVATFVPTDVDARIRHHVWQSVTSVDALERLCGLVDEVARWPATVVSERAVDLGLGPMSGHDGEWLGVRAGALLRADELGADGHVARLSAAIDEELERERQTLERAWRTGDARSALSAITIVAHNLGDLSRVVSLWPRRPSLAAARERLTRLGHPDGATRVPSFVAAGEINKRLMATENHRFLALRKPRALRRSRELLLPIGPWFDAWGARIATCDELDARDRGDIMGALLHLHARAPRQAGCLRGLAGLHQATAGGLSSIAEFAPARLRKEIGRGAVRDAIDLPRERFEEPFSRRFEAVAGPFASSFEG
jgi:hypothetical protein